MGPEKAKKGILKSAVAASAAPGNTTGRRFPAVEGPGNPSWVARQNAAKLAAPAVSKPKGPTVPSAPSMTTAQSTPALPKAVQQAKMANPTALAAGKGKKLGLLKKTIEPLKKNNEPKPLNTLPKQMPLKNFPKQMPIKRLPKMPVKPKMPSSPAPFQPGYKPGSHLRGYTKFA